MSDPAAVLFGITNCLLALFVAYNALRLLQACKLRFKRLCILPVFTSFSYVVLELEWILAARYESIGSIADYAWLACEAGWMVSVIVALRVLLSSKEVCPYAYKCTPTP